VSTIDIAKTRPRRTSYRFKWKINSICTTSPCEGSICSETWFSWLSTRFEINRRISDNKQYSSSCWTKRVNDFEYELT